MAPAEKTESTVTADVGDRSTAHHEGLNSGSARGYSSPLLGEDRDRTKERLAGGRTSFAGAGGWAVTL